MDDTRTDRAAETDGPATRRAASADKPIKVVDRRWWARDETGAPEAERAPLKPTYVEELERQLADKDRQIQDYLGRYREAASEFDATRARMRREIGKEIERGRRTLLVELLEVLDNLDRALDAAAGATSVESLIAGVRLVRDQFLAKLEGFGVRRIEPLGQRFDPAQHEAVSTAPASDPSQDGMVIGVIARGYLIGDEILRPAIVAVARREGAEGAEIAE